MICCGVDPGAETGIVALQIPPTWDLSRATWLGSVRRTPSRSEKLTELERDRLFIETLRQSLAGFTPDLVVIENPLDARPYWQTKGREAGRPGKRRVESPETRYRQGCYYAYAIAAVPESARAVSYVVKGRANERGWMGVRSHDLAAAQSRLLVKALGRSSDGLSDHELMALGVLVHHVELERTALWSERALKAAAGGLR